MVKDSDKPHRGFDVGESGGRLSGLLAEEDEFDRHTLWRLGTWAAVAVGAVVVALVTNQSAIGWRHEQSASADLLRQAQQIQLAARENQGETRRLASAVDTLNSDRDRLYSRVAVLEQGLDSVTGTIARQAPASSPQATAGPTNTSQVNSPQVNATQASVAPSAAPSPAPAAPSVPVASTAPAATASTPPASTASVDQPPANKPSPVAPAVAPVAATAPAVLEKQDKQAAIAPPSEPSPAAKPANIQQPPAAQASGSLVASKSMMGPPDPAAGKFIEPAAPPKTVTSAPMHEALTVVAKASESKASEKKPDDAEPDAAPELVARHTEFGVDVGGANSVPGLRALWRGLLKSHSNAALTTLRPIIVIKESNSGLGMQLRLVAGPINDAAAAAKICASLTVTDRGCTTAVYEGQRLTMNSDEQAKADDKSAESKPASDAKSESDSKTSRYSSRSRHYGSRHSSREEDPPPKPEPSTLSRLFGR